MFGFKWQKEETRIRLNEKKKNKTSAAAQDVNIDHRSCSLNRVQMEVRGRGWRMNGAHGRVGEEQEGGILAPGRGKGNER